MDPASEASSFPCPILLVYDHIGQLVFRGHTIIILAPCNGIFRIHWQVRLRIWKQNLVKSGMQYVISSTVQVSILEISSLLIVPPEKHRQSSAPELYNSYFEV